MKRLPALRAGALWFVMTTCVAMTLVVPTCVSTAFAEEDRIYLFTDDNANDQAFTFGGSAVESSSQVEAQSSEAGATKASTLFAPPMVPEAKSATKTADASKEPVEQKTTEPATRLEKQFAKNDPDVLKANRADLATFVQPVLTDPIYRASLSDKSSSPTVYPESKPDHGTTISDLDEYSPGCDIGCDLGCDIGCDFSCDGGCDAACPGFEPLFDMDLWVEFGVTHNNLAPQNPRAGLGNFPVGFNYRDATFQLQQTYLVVKREADTSSRNLDWGGRVDLLYGEDYIFTTAVGLEQHQNTTPKWNGNVNGNGFLGTNRNGLAMPQAYGEIGWSDVRIKVGHWYTTIGYETVTAVDNFFYSHAYTMQFGEPFTHTGILGEWNWGDLTLFGGVHNGWNVWWREGVGEMPTSGIAGFNLTSSDGDISLSAMATFGQDADGRTVTALGQPRTFSQRTMYSVVAQFQLGCRTQLILQHDLGVQENGRGAGLNAAWYGVNGYLLQELNDKWKAGVRAEWYNDQNGFTVGLPSHYYEVTFGLNWKPTSSIRIRPEVRFDWQDFHRFGSAGVFDVVGSPLPSSTQLTAAIDAIIRF